MSAELVRLVDSIHRDRDIDKELVFQALEDALATATRKHYGQREEIEIRIDRETGEITGTVAGEVLDLAKLGRIDAQTAKQVIIQKTKELESDVVFADFAARIGQIINGSVQRIEGSNVIVNLGRVEGLLPRREQVRDETYRIGERLKCIILDVKRFGQRVKILLSRTHPDIVRSLFELEVPEVTDGIIEIRQLAREPGSRTKIAVISHDMKVDCVGACVGVRGSRIKSIVVELGGEKIDIVRYSDQPEAYIANALNPAEISNIGLNPLTRRAKVIVAEDQLSLAIGKRGQNVRLAAKLTGWAIDVMSQDQYERRSERTKEVLLTIPGIGEVIAERFSEAGYHVQDLALADIDTITQINGIVDQKAKEIISIAKDALVIIKAEEAERTATRKAAQPQDARMAAQRLFATIDAEDQQPAEAAEDGPEHHGEGAGEAPTEPESAENEEPGPLADDDACPQSEDAGIAHGDVASNETELPAGDEPQD